MDAGGVKDLSGNVNTTPFRSTFSTGISITTKTGGQKSNHGVKENSQKNQAFINLITPKGFNWNGNNVLGRLKSFLLGDHNSLN